MKTIYLHPIQRDHYTAATHVARTFTTYASHDNNTYEAVPIVAPHFADAKQCRKWIQSAISQEKDLMAAGERGFRRVES